MLSHRCRFAVSVGCCLAVLSIIAAGLLSAVAASASGRGRPHHTRSHGNARHARGRCPSGKRRVRRHGHTRCVRRRPARHAAPGSRAPGSRSATPVFRPTVFLVRATNGTTSPPGPSSPSETWEGFSAANPMPAGRTPGNASSPFNERLHGPTVLANSAEMVAYLLSQHEPGTPMPGTHEPSKNGGHPIVYASNSDPIVELIATEHWGANPLQGRRIKIPVQAHASEPAPPGDAHLEIVLAPDEAKVPGEAVDLWRAEPVKEGKLRFSWGGPANIAGTLLQSNGWSATASDFDLSAGQIRAPELKAGVVPHALCAAIPEPKHSYVYPASDSDGTGSQTAAPPMGQRFYLAYSEAEIEALPVAPWKKAVLKALANYGFYICDSGNDTLGFEFESSLTYTAFGQPDPFSVIGAEQGVGGWEGNYVFSFAEGVEWTRLRAIAPPPG